MKNPLVRPLALLLTAALLVLGFDLATYAATGDSLILGRANKATKVTTLTRTTNGPVLALRGKPSSPPLTVSSGRKVARLNADKLDGLDAAALRTRVTTYGLPAAAPSTLLNWDLPLAPGTYLVNWSAQFAPGATGDLVCGFHNASYSDLPTAQMATASAFTADILSGSGMVTTTAAVPYEFFCQSTAGALVPSGGGVRVTVQKPVATSVVARVAARTAKGGLRQDR